MTKEQQFYQEVGWTIQKFIKEGLTVNQVVGVLFHLSVNVVDVDQLSAQDVPVHRKD